jgi:hypothetical protein
LRAGNFTELASAQLAKAIHLERSQGSIEELRLAHLRLEPSARKRIDLACEYWIEHGQWPVMEREDAAFVWERLNEAQLAGRMFYVFGGLCVQSEATRDKILHFLLIGFWEQYARHRNASQALDR